MALLQQVEQLLKFHLRQVLEEHKSFEETNLRRHLSLLCPLQHTHEVFRCQRGQIAICRGPYRCHSFFHDFRFTFTHLGNEGELTEPSPRLQVDEMLVDQDYGLVLVISELGVLLVPPDVALQDELFFLANRPLGDLNYLTRTTFSVVA